MAHTPGPWNVLAGTIIVTDNEDKKWIGEVPPASRVLKQFLEDRANARLIAAAPDLMAACEAIFDALAKGELTWKHKRQSDSDPYHPANVKLCAAIAKAKGE